MVRERLTRRSVLAAAGVAAASVAGCTGEGSCRAVVDGTETVEPNTFELYEIEAEAGQRLYVMFRRLDGPQIHLSVYDPREEPLMAVAGVERIERVFDIDEAGLYSVVARSESTMDRSRWEATLAVYCGWCAAVF